MPEIEFEINVPLRKKRLRLTCSKEMVPPVCRAEVGLQALRSVAYHHLQGRETHD